MNDSRKANMFENRAKAGLSKLLEVKIQRKREVE